MGPSASKDFKLGQIRISAKVARAAWINFMRKLLPIENIDDWSNFFKENYSLSMRHGQQPLH